MMLRAVFAMLLALVAIPAAASDMRITSSALGNIFSEGDTIAFVLHTDADQVRWSAKNFFGAEVASGAVTVTGGAVTLQPHIPELGYFTLDVSTESGSTAQAHTTLAILPHPKPASANSPFGVVTHFAKEWPTDLVPLIEKAGIKRVRDEQPWRKVEKQLGQYEFPPRLTSYMAELAAHNIDPLTVLAFSNPLYDGDKTPTSDQGRAGYAAYARAVAQHYGPQLSAVEIWNEYNGSFCEGPCRSDRAAYYTSMLRDTYGALKKQNPALTVAGGAAVPIPLDYFQGLFKNGALDAMDAVVIHPYRKEPEGVEDKIGELHQLMQQYGKVKPIWATEFGDLADMRKSRDDVARYLVRMSTLLLSAKVDRIYWYLMKDYQEFSGLGLVRNEDDTLGRYAPTPAYAAYATLIHQLDGARFIRREPSDPQLRVYLFSNDGEEIRVAWSTESTGTYEISSAGALREIDMMGNGKDIPHPSGTASIALDQNPVYLVSRPPPH